MPHLVPVRRLIYLYFFLLIFEGALRFWVFPSLSSVLLLIRDPVVILIYLTAASAGVLPGNGAITLALLLAILTGATSFIGGLAPPLVTAFGLRANFLHLPLIYVIANVLTGEDVLRIGRWMMWIMLPMAVLVVQQFRSPVGTLINLGGMPTQYGTVRPAGTFSFVSGMVCFTALVAAFLGDSFVHASQRKGWILKILCAVAVLAALAVSGSRSSIFAVGIVFVVLIGLSLTRGQAVSGALVLLAVIGLGTAGLSSTEFFEEGQKQLAKRFEDGSQGKGVVGSSLERWGNMFLFPVWAAQQAPLFGNGQGTGTNAGYWLTTGQRGFGGGQETELGRIMYEMGGILGTIFLLLRIGIALELFRACQRALNGGNLLPMLLFGAVGMNVVMGSWGIPMTQGFASFGAGICFASVKVGLLHAYPREWNEPYEDEWLDEEDDDWATV